MADRIAAAAAPPSPGRAATRPASGIGVLWPVVILGAVFVFVVVPIRLVVFVVFVFVFVASILHALSYRRHIFRFVYCVPYCKYHPARKFGSILFYFPRSSKRQLYFHRY